jgi:hypothetical protein
VVKAYRTQAAQPTQQAAEASMKAGPKLSAMP